MSDNNLTYLYTGLKLPSMKVKVAEVVYFLGACARNLSTCKV